MEHSPPPFFRTGPTPLARLLIFSTLSLTLLVADARFKYLEVLRQIKNDPALKMIPVVVMTSSREEPDVVASYRLGVNAYVVKPVQFENFVEAVQQVGVFWAVLNEPPPICVGPPIKSGPST